MTQYWSKMKQWKSAFLPRARGEQGGRKMRFASKCKFCVFAKQIFSWHLYFFSLDLILVLEFQKKNSGRINYMEESYVSSEWKFGRLGWFVSFFGSRWRRGHMTDSKDMLETRDWANSAKKWLVIWLCPWDFRTCPQDCDMSLTCLGHFQLSSIQHRFDRQILCLCWTKYCKTMWLFKNLLHFDILPTFCQHVNEMYN